MSGTSAAGPRPGPSAAPAAEERHASWLELFFDLVTVAGIGMLAHLLSADASAGGVAVYTIAYAAYWLVWACFTAYGNARGDEAKTATVLLAMALMGVMTAAVPEIRGEHAEGFAIAYVLARFVAARPWHGAVVADFPLAQALLGVVPWVVSLWVDPPWKYELWALGLVIDLVYLLVVSRDRLVEGGQQRVDQNVERFTRRAAQLGVEIEHHADDELGLVMPSRSKDDPRVARRRLPTINTAVRTVSADLPHLEERFGLFVLIVLGEGLVQIIDGASEARWDRPLLITGIGGFVLIALLWNLVVQRGYAGVSLLADAGVPVRVAWVTHLVSTGALATLAAVVGRLVADPGEDVPTHDLVVITAAFLVHGIGSALVHLARARTVTGAERREALVRAAWVGLPTACAGALVLTFEGLDAEQMLWILTGGLLVTYAATTRWERPASRRREPHDARS